MAVIEREPAERILTSLDSSGLLFPEFRLKLSDGKPVLVGYGGFSSVYEVCYENGSDFGYVMKVIGFGEHNVSSEQFRSTTALQRLLCEQTPCVCRLIDTKELLIQLDDEGELKQVCETSEERWLGQGLHLQLILLEKYKEIICKDRFGNRPSLINRLEKEDEIKRFAFQIGHALMLAHSSDILHRDIKLENIFYSERDDCYALGDFGLARSIADENAETVVYTNGYGAPEIERHLSDHYNTSADIYSFGITLYLLYNDLRFPGSDGYYVNNVQYNPEFSFPAPAHASVGMARIIHKMCAYRPEDRYQSVSEMLLDLKRLDVKQTSEYYDEQTYYDFETRTYLETQYSLPGENNENAGTEKIPSRYERKINEKYQNYDYLFFCTVVSAGIAATLLLFLRGTAGEASAYTSWQLVLLPIAVAIEAFLQRMKELHLLFGILTIGFGAYTAAITGMYVPTAVMILCLATGIPSLTFSSAAASGVWLIIMTSGKMRWLGVTEKYELGWLFLAAALVLIHHIIYLRIIYTKASERGFFAWKVAFYRLLPILTATGILVSILQKIDVFQLPEAVQRLHLVRSGLTSFAAITLLSKKYWSTEESDCDKQMDE